MKTFCLALVLLPSLAAPAQSPDYHADPKFQKELAAAKQPHQRHADELDHWKRALKISNGACAPCLSSITSLNIQMGEYKDAVKSASTLEDLVTNPSDKAYAELLRGTALTHFNHDSPKPEQLVDADQAFKAALKHNPKLYIAEYLDGRALAALNRDEEARTLFVSYVASTPATDHLHLRAEHFAENPALARARMAPPFTVTTADGKSFTLDEMGGRVVLVDFWATWCGPCNQELPHIQKIAQEFAGQPFVLISVSWDSDAAKWQSFLDKHGMTWNQYRDADHALSNAYGVQAIPHYFTIDSDGILQDEKIGSGSNIEGKLKKLVARAKSSPTPPPTPANTAASATPPSPGAQ